MLPSCGLRWDRARSFVDAKDPPRHEPERPAKAAEKLGNNSNNFFSWRESSLKRCNLANGAATTLSSSTRSPIMHDEQRKRLVCIAEHEVCWQRVLRVLREWRQWPCCVIGAAKLASLDAHRLLLPAGDRSGSVGAIRAAAGGGGRHDHHGASSSRMGVFSPRFGRPFRPDLGFSLCLDGDGRGRTGTLCRFLFTHKVCF